MLGFLQRKGKLFKQEGKEMWNEVSYFCSVGTIENCQLTDCVSLHLNADKMNGIIITIIIIIVIIIIISTNV